MDVVGMLIIDEIIFNEVSTKQYPVEKNDLKNLLTLIFKNGKLSESDYRKSLEILYQSDI